MFAKFRYKGERLWLRVLSVSDDNFAARVWNHLVNLGFLFWADDTDSDL